jgi:1-acyl-sn-glycerol-3-phosphate acyltransferase
MIFMPLDAENLLWTKKLIRLKPAELAAPFKLLKQQFDNVGHDSVHVQEMLPDIRRRFLQVSLGGLVWMLKRMAAHTWVVGGERLGALQKMDRDHTLVFVANHCSNADYIFLPLMVNQMGLWHTHILASSKLNIFPFGWLYKRWGAYFVRQGERSLQYYKLLKAWLAYLLAKNFNLLVFPEGGLSQDGLLRNPQSGFFKILMNASEIKKVIVVPVMFAYDWVPEDRQLVYKKNHKPENWTYWRKIKMLKFFRNYGDMYCRVYEPMYMQDWLAKNKAGSPDLLVEQIFEQFRSQPIVSGSSFLAKVALEHPDSDREILKEKFVALCAQYQNAIVFKDDSAEFDRIYGIFKSRELFSEPDILKYYANHLENGTVE